MSPTDVSAVTKTIDVLVDLLVGEVSSNAPIAFPNVKTERDQIVRTLKSIPATFEDWWKREPR